MKKHPNLLAPLLQRDTWRRSVRVLPVSPWLRSASLLGLMLLCVSCQADAPQSQSPSPSPTPIAKGKAPAPKTNPKPEAVKLESSPVFQMALDKAESASNIAESAQSPDDWQLVVSRWKEAIQLLKRTPKSDPNFREVQARLAAFQAGLAKAQERLDRAQGRTPNRSYVAIDPKIGDEGASTSTAAPGNRTYRARIKYYDGGIPVIDVLFNGKFRFEMLVDTGATGTMITESMADTLGVKAIGAVPAFTPAGRTQFAVGTVKSISVGGGSMYEFPVAIGPVALLGHDFFGDCDITIRRNQNLVEFSRCSN